MAVYLSIDDELLLFSKKVNKNEPKKVLFVTIGLKNIFARQKHKKIIDLFNDVEYDDNYDYRRLKSKRFSTSVN